MPYFEKRIYSGQVLEVERYYATKGGRPIGSRNADESTKAQEELNSVQSWRKLWRMLNCNFCRENGDKCITLQFSRKVDEAEANRQYTAFMRRIRAARKKRGLDDLRYIIVRESQSGRQHAHMVLNDGLSLEELTELWGQGMVWGAKLDNTNNCKELARYLTRQHKPRKGSGKPENAKDPRQKRKRRWTCSRNLKKPIVKKRACRPVTVHTMPRAPKGYELTPEVWRDADSQGNMWLRWVCRKLPEPVPKRRATLHGRMIC